MRTVDTANPKTQEVFDFIVQFKTANDGNSPSVEQIKNACDITSTSVVMYYLGKLENAGKITRELLVGGEIGKARRIRNIRVVGAKWSPPTANTVAA